MTEIKQIAPPDLTSTLENAARGTKVGMNAVQIGIINSFNPTNQTATIQLALKQVVAVAPDGSRTIREHPLILECPVMTMFGGDSFINMPIAAGDNCIVLFNDREIDNWLYNGGLQTPTTARVHDISDAIAIVGIRHYQNSIAQFLANGIRISFSANSRMDFTDDEINSIAGLFTHNGDVFIDGSLTLSGRMYGNSIDDTIDMDANLVQQPGREIHAGNGATGTFNSVTVVDGIVTGGS